MAETVDTILTRMLENMSESIDKREGSIAYDAVAPVAIELASLQTGNEGILQEAFATTATRDYLVLRAREQGIYPEDATYATYKGAFNIEIELGTRFNKDSLNFVVARAYDESETGEYNYILTCETSGTVGNDSLGSLLPIDFVDGLTYAKLVELLVPGEDEEDTEVFRERYFDKVNEEAYGGNRADYIEATKKIAGVGQVKANRTPDNVGGTVEVIITDSENNPASEELLAKVKDTLDPEAYEGLGYGIMPIGHKVIVNTTDTLEVNINAFWATDVSSDVSNDQVIDVINTYIDEVNAEWEDNESLKLYAAHIISRILEIDGVIDVVNVTINGELYCEAESNQLFALATLNG